MAATADTISTSRTPRKKQMQSEKQQQQDRQQHNRDWNDKGHQPLQGHQNQWNLKHWKVHNNENFFTPILNFLLLRFWEKKFWLDHYGGRAINVPRSLKNKRKQKKFKIGQNFEIIYDPFIFDNNRLTATGMVLCVHIGPNVIINSS
jgi:hypothetical protein